MALLAACIALVALPGLAEAERGKGKGKGKAKKCVIHPGFVVKGTLVSFTADKADTTDTNEASVALKVTGANKHARRSGISKGDEVTYTAADDKDGFKVRLSGYEEGNTPDDNDKVRVVGKIAYTKKKCAPDKTREERYGDVNVRRVKILDVGS
jgi:hypothetical protein